MQTPKIDEIGEIVTYRPKRSTRRCFYFDDELCCAPQIKFRACANCSRLDPRLVVVSMFNKIKEMAEKFLSFSGLRAD
ncbi:MAG: hypothetical protein WC405_18370 [Syntrophales bacterium]